MGRKLLLALAASAALAVAGQAHCEIVELTASGNWNDVRAGWSLDVVFDTNHGVESQWTDQDGGLGHMLDVGSTISGTVICDGLATAVSNLVLYQSTHALVASVPGGYVGVGGGSLFDAVLPFDQPMSARMGYNYEAGDGTFGSVEFAPREAWANSIALADLGPSPGVVAAFSLAEVASPTPEPATWAMLIVGLGATGAALRRRRQAYGALA